MDVKFEVDFGYIESANVSKVLTDHSFYTFVRRHVVFDFSISLI